MVVMGKVPPFFILNINNVNIMINVNLLYNFDFVKKILVSEDDAFNFFV